MIQSLEIQVGDWLRQGSLKLVVAESCTGGLIGHRITNVPGSSEYYLGSITAYSYGVKQSAGVCPETLLGHGAVSRQTVLKWLVVCANVAASAPMKSLASVSRIAARRRHAR